MIREFAGMEPGKPATMRYERCTPKRRAALDLAAAIQGFTENMDIARTYPEMTMREVEQVTDQIFKLETRLLKLLNIG